jgi:AraC-like DNA-binding protein
MNFLKELLLAGAAQGLLLAAVILSLRPSTNNTASRLLALIVGLESAHLFFLYLSYSIPGATPLSFRALFGLRVLDAPALFLYVCALTDDRFRLDRPLLKHLWVMLPVLVLLAYVGGRADWRGMSTIALQHDNTTMYWSLYHSTVFIGYGVAALLVLEQHLRRMRHAVSSLDIVGLTWLQRLIVAVIAAHLAHVGFDVLRLLQVLGPQPKIVLNLAATVAVIYWLSIGGLRQQAIFTESIRTALAAVDRDASAEAAAHEHEHGKYAKSGLDDDRTAEIWLRLQQRLRNEQPFLDPQLDLPALAKQVGVRPQELSQVINSRSGGSFYDLINTYRIEAAKTLLRSDGDQRRKMLDIALSVGFSSQSTFYHQFKKLTGVTPSMYRERPLQQPA